MMNRLMKRRGESGFTLIELLVVVLVIGVLSGIVVLAVSNSTTDAKKKACLANASALLTALDVYRSSAGNGTPLAATGTTTSLTVNGASKSFKAYTAADMAALVPSYIKSLPDIGTAAETAVTAYVATTADAQIVVSTTGTQCGGSTIVGG